MNGHGENTAKFSGAMVVAIQRVRQLKQLRATCNGMQCWLSQDIALESALLANIRAMSALCTDDERMIIVRAMGTN